MQFLNATHEHSPVVGLTFFHKVSDDNSHLSTLFYKLSRVYQFLTRACKSCTLFSTLSDTWQTSSTSSLSLRVLLTCKDLALETLFSVPVTSTILWQTLWTRTVREHREWRKLVTDIVSAHLFYQTSRSIVRRIIQMMMTQPCWEGERPQETSVPSFVYSGHCFDWDTIDERFARITLASRPRSSNWCSFLGQRQIIPEFVLENCCWL